MGAARAGPLARLWRGGLLHNRRRSWRMRGPRRAAGTSREANFNTTPATVCRRGKSQLTRTPWDLQPQLAGLEPSSELFYQRLRFGLSDGATFLRAAAADPARRVGNLRSWDSHTSENVAGENGFLRSPRDQIRKTGAKVTDFSPAATREADYGKSRNCGGPALKYLKNFVAERPFCA